MGDLPAGEVARAPLEIGALVAAPTADGVSAAARYGDRAAEERALRAGCGLVDRLWVEHLELGGDDRVRFLNGMITANVQALAPGDGLFAFFTSPQGRILAEARVEALADRLLLELPAGRSRPIAEHLSRYVVADRVELVPRPGLRALALVGPRAGRVAARLGGEGPAAAPWSHAAVDWRGHVVILTREERLGGPAITLRVGEDGAAELARELTRPEGGDAATPAGFEAAEALRVEAARARYGPDFADERFPQEVGAEEAIDYDKGCYLGQEVVARIHYRGKVNHRLCGLHLDGDVLPPPRTPVTLEGHEVGLCGTAVLSPTLGHPLALAILHRKAQAGARVDVAGIAAQVLDPPFS